MIRSDLCETPSNAPACAYYPGTMSFFQALEAGFRDRVHRSLISERGSTAGAWPQLWAALMLLQETIRGENPPYGLWDKNCVQGQGSVGGKEALSADSLGQGSMIHLPDSNKAQIQSQCVYPGGIACLHGNEKRAENQVPKTQGISCNLEILHFANRTEPGTEQNLMYSFIQQVFV